MIKLTYLKTAAVLMTVIFLFSSCASIVSESRYPLSINSSPSNARITITNNKGYEVYMGVTPATVQLNASDGFFSKAEYRIRFSSPGYDDKIIPVTTSIDGWYFGNILLFPAGGIIGMLIIDPATGAMWKLDTEYLNVTLFESTPLSMVPEMKILNINEVPEEWKEHLVSLD